MLLAWLGWASLPFALFFLFIFPQAEIVEKKKEGLEVEYIRKGNILGALELCTI